jgi:tetratricopeptide (TPR) repeat protein
MPILHIRSLAVALFLAASSAGAQLPPTSPAAARADSVYRAGDYAAAAAAYRALASETPTALAYWARLGISLQHIEKFPEAADAYRRALAIQPVPVIAYNLGAAEARLGHVDQAFRWVDSAAVLGFGSESTFTHDPDFAPYRGDARFAMAAQAVHRAAAPCEFQPASTRFDFWVGEWDVTTPQGAHAGSSSVQKILGGCVVFENWTAASGAPGKSLNAYNSGLKMWQQFWTSASGNVTEYRHSTWVDGSLQFVAHVPDVDSPTELRMTFTPVDSNTVRQFGELSTDSGKTWKSSFDLYYHRKT